MVMSALSGSDPRFATHIPLMKSLRITTPSGLTLTGSETREVTLSTPSNPLTLTSATNRLTVNGRTHTRVYNAAQRQFTLTTPQARQSITRIDIQGRVIEEQVTAITPFTYGYDSRGRLETIAQGTRTTTFTYDARGNLETVTDPFARTSSFTYDSIGRVTREVLPGGREIFYTYDAAGNLTSLTPPSRPAHGFAYTSVDLANRYEPPALGIDSVATRYTYNVDRQLSSVVRPDGLSITLNYDTAGRIRSVALPGDSLVYAYSPTTGKLSGIAAPGGVAMSYTYDGALPKSVSWTGPVPGSVGVTYNANYEVTQQTVNGGHAVDFQYDNDGLLTATGAMMLTRSPQNGLITGTTIGSVSSTQKYSALGELDSLSYDFAGATQFRMGYTRDALGRITQRVETVLGSTTVYDFAYDTAGRLAEVRRDSVLVESYGYNANGNRTSFTDLSGTITGTYDDQDRLLTYGDATYTYTANGELTSNVLPTGTTSYTYDVLGNLRTMTLSDSTVIEYVVDGQNRRVGKRVNGTLVQGFLYSGQLTPTAELDEVGNVVSRFVYGTRVNVPDYMVKDGVTYRLITDQLGSVRLVVNAAIGAVVQRIDYDAFGRVTLNTMPGFQPFGFAGGLYDEHTGLVRFGARDYDSEIGRWTRKDPIGFSGRSSDLYGYVLQDPINLIDIDGEFPIPLVVAGAVLGGAIGGGWYAMTAGERFSWRGFAGAAAGGAVAGGIGVIATPLATLSGLGTGLAGTAGVNALAGVAASAVTAGLDPCIRLSPEYALASAAFGSIGGAVGQRFFKTRGMSVFTQKGFPRTWSGVWPSFLGGGAGRNAMNAIYVGGSVSLFIGAAGPTITN